MTLTTLISARDHYMVHTLPNRMWNRKQTSSYPALCKMSGTEQDIRLIVSIKVHPPQHVHSVLKCQPVSNCVLLCAC